MDPEFELEWPKSKDKEFIRLFEINSMFRTSVDGFFPTCHALITWLELSRVKLCRNELRMETKITSS